MEKEEEMSRVEEEDEDDDRMGVDDGDVDGSKDENQNGSGGKDSGRSVESSTSSSSGPSSLLLANIQQPPPPPSGPSGPPHNVVIKWAGKNIEIEDINGLKTVRDLKLTIQSKTGVQPERQKLLNLNFKGKLALDDCLLANLNLKVGMKIMMMGSLERDYESVDVPPEERPDVNNDLDIPEDDDKPLENKEVYLNKVTRRIKEYNVKILNPLREGKKLLVLDIDYTLFDHRSAAETGVELMRPFLHEFLTSAYADYDIVIWSATSMKWIEEKMKLLGVASHSSYKIAFYLDYLAMISVHTQKYGVIDVKPLGVIWGKYPQLSPRNTIMFDDLRRNFIMNPQSGLRIRPFRSAHVNRSNDRELLRLASYLRKIARLDDFSQLNHKRWESYLSKANARKHYSSHSSSKRHQEDRTGGSGSGGPSSAGGSNTNTSAGGSGDSSQEPAA